MAASPLLPLEPWLPTELTLLRTPLLPTWIREAAAPGRAGVAGADEPLLLLAAKRGVLTLPALLLLLLPPVDCLDRAASSTGKSVTAKGAPGTADADAGATATGPDGLRGGEEAPLPSLTGGSACICCLVDILPTPYDWYGAAVAAATVPG